MGESSLKVCAWGNVPFHIPSTFDHSIYISSLISLYSGVLKPSYQRALLLTSVFVYYELRIICFERRKFYLFLVITSPILLTIVST